MALPLLSAAHIGAAVAQTPAVTISIRDASLGYGQDALVRGRTQPGRAVALQFRPPGGAWRTLATGTSRTDGTYRLGGTLRRSGLLRVAIRGTAGAPRSFAGGVPAGEAGALASAARPVSVRARLRVTARRLDVLAGERAAVRGAVRFSRAGRVVILERWRAGSWRILGRTRTGIRGTFRVQTRALGLGSHPARLRFAGDRHNARAVQPLGRVSAYRASHASWYGPGLYGNRLACGGRLSTSTLGVAHKGLPCGTLVTFRYRGRSVRVPVVDRGPFVGGRTWDLTAATRQRLGFGSTGTIWSSR